MVESAVRAVFTGRESAHPAKSLAKAATDNLALDIRAGLILFAQAGDRSGRPALCADEGFFLVPFVVAQSASIVAIGVVTADHLSRRPQRAGTGRAGQAGADRAAYLQLRRDHRQPDCRRRCAACRRRIGTGRFGGAPAGQSRAARVDGCRGAAPGRGRAGRGGADRVDRGKVYGVNAPDAGWNDYEGLDVKGKVVVVLVNDPGFIRKDPELFKGQTMTYYGRWTYKFEEAARQGAAGVLIVHETEAAAYGWEVIRNGWSGPQFDLPPEEDADPRMPIQGGITTSLEAPVAPPRCAGQKRCPGSTSPRRPTECSPMTEPLVHG